MAVSFDQILNFLYMFGAFFALRVVLIFTRVGRALVDLRAVQASYTRATLRLGSLAVLAKVFVGTAFGSQVPASSRGSRVGRSICCSVLAAVAAVGCINLKLGDGCPVLCASLHRDRLCRHN